MNEKDKLSASASPTRSDSPKHVAPDPFLQQLTDRVCTSEILIKPGRRGYYFGEDVEAEIHGLDGSKLGNERFAVGASPGSGFAGQVYRAIPERGIISDPSNLTEENAPVALKVLRPKSRWKETFRDILFKLSYQTSFVPRLREEALRSGLIWQELFRIAAGIEFGTDSVIAKPLGYYWDSGVASYVEIAEWVSGRDQRYEADDQIVTRWMSKTKKLPDSEVIRKRKFMGDLVRLCHEMGAIGLARQYEWYTFVSQANILTRIEQRDGLSEFVVVDCRPGLAFPYFLPLSPIDVRIILQGLRRGVFAHFDEVDFNRLDTYLAAHVNEFAHADGLILQLKEDDERYRSGLPNVWHFRGQLLRDKDLQRGVREASIRDWQKVGKVSDMEAENLKGGSKKYIPYLILDNIPLGGQPIMHLLANEKYREHAGRILKDPGYLKEVAEVKKASDVFEWNDTQRSTTDRAMNLADSTPRYLLEKAILGWSPKGVHRLATDAEARNELVHNLVINPVSLLIDRKYREKWFNNIIERQAEKGVVSTEQLEVLKQQAGEGRMQGFVRDLGFTVGTEAASKSLYVVLAAYGLTTNDFLPLGIAMLGPISPSGIVREAYVLSQLVYNLPHIVMNRDGKLLRTRTLGAVVAPWRSVGNFFAPLEMFAYYNDMSLLLCDYYASKMISIVPVFGGKGTLLEHWAFQVAYNLPLSVRRAMTEIKSKNDALQKRSSLEKVESQLTENLSIESVMTVQLSKWD